MPEHVEIQMKPGQSRVVLASSSDIVTHYIVWYLFSVMHAVDSGYG